MELNLGPRQKATIAGGLTAAGLVMIVWVILRGIQLLGQFITTFSSVFLPLAVAGILALLLRPFYRFLLYKWRIRPVLAVAVIYVTIFIPLIMFSSFFGAIAVGQITDLVDKVPEMVDSARDQLNQRLPRARELWDKHGMSEKARDIISARGGMMLKTLGTAFSSALAAGTSVFRRIAGGLGWFVVPVYLAFFLVAKPLPKNWLEDYLPFLKPQTRRDVVYLVSEFVEIIVAFFRGQIVVAFMQGILFAIGFSLVGLKYGFVIGMLLGILNVIPYLGSMIGLAIALPLALFQPEGGVMTFSLVIVVFMVVQLIEGYVLTPRIMGDTTGLHPLAIMVALFFWGTAFDGIMGMVMAIPLTAFLVVFWRLAKTKYIKPLL